ncbi:hypothetical protein B1C78_06650 [Thioalkalivibrio denitrificans]|uniref:DUF3892 domain-containing protein n=1 Tax=Thioalkalivibrio denitrificans TaxID=108003 RepID=A0A1V3NK38_9GAMM|nr:hypothetical protein [Thioalkalivibrio denitrificans]OOG25420.1 hypothetical protein B1C78_06650 [Thioalkalivibrio denitrificans]
MGDAHIKIVVECHAGYRGEEEPRALRIGERRTVVEEILDRWLAPDHRYFKLRCDDGGVYLLRHDNASHPPELLPAMGNWGQSLRFSHE